MQSPQCNRRDSGLFRGQVSQANSGKPQAHGRCLSLVSRAVCSHNNADDCVNRDGDGKITESHCAQKQKALLPTDEESPRKRYATNPLNATLWLC